MDRTLWRAGKSKTTNRTPVTTPWRDDTTNRTSGTTSRKIGTPEEPAVTTARKLETAGDEVSANQTWGGASDGSTLTAYRRRIRSTRLFNHTKSCAGSVGLQRTSGFLTLRWARAADARCSQRPRYPRRHAGVRRHTRPVPKPDRLSGTRLQRRRNFWMPFPPSRANRSSRR